MGLNVDVFRNSSHYDCTNGGMTSRFNRVCLVNVDGPFEPTLDIPAAVLVKGNLPNTAKVVPEEALNNNGDWTIFGAPKIYMFGGNFVATRDSRFNRAVEEITGYRFYGAIPVHDRVE
jgi:hypothetical protein